MWIKQGNQTVTLSIGQNSSKTFQWTDLGTDFQGYMVKVYTSSNDYKTGAINLDCLSLGEFNENSIRLADAAFETSGATHIELGAGPDNVAMLPYEYYPNASKSMTGSLQNAMKQNNKFITTYENLLFDPIINYGDQGNQYININGESISCF